MKAYFGSNRNNYIFKRRKRILNLLEGNYAFQRKRCIVGVHHGLRVDLRKTEGLFCKNDRQKGMVGFDLNDSD